MLKFYTRADGSKRPYFVWKTKSLPKEINAQTILMFIRINAESHDAEREEAHELFHVDQLYLSFGMSIFSYFFSKKGRYNLELEPHAYEAQRYNDIRQEAYTLYEFHGKRAGYTYEQVIIDVTTFKPRVLTFKLTPNY